VVCTKYFLILDFVFLNDKIKNRLRNGAMSVVRATVRKQLLGNTIVSLDCFLIKLRY